MAAVKRLPLAERLALMASGNDGGAGGRSRLKKTKKDEEKKKSKYNTQKQT